MNDGHILMECGKRLISENERLLNTNSVQEAISIKKKHNDPKRVFIQQRIEGDYDVYREV